jgi:membrane protein
LKFDLRGLGDDLLGTVPRFRRHNGLQLCAGVSFYALLSLPVLLYLTAALLGRVLRDDHVTERVLAALQPLFPATAGESLRQVALDLRTDNPLVLVALPALFWVATTVFASLSLAVNVAFERTRRRTVVLARLKSFALVSVGMIALLASLVASTSLHRLERLLWEATVLPEGTRLAGSFSRFLIVLAPLALFATFYKVLPRGRVRWRSAGWGALLALALWEAARRVFGRVLVHSPALGLFSGALSGMVTVLLWVYASVALVLLGAEFAALRHERIESLGTEQ